jgi:hypothetical protein
MASGDEHLVIHYFIDEAGDPVLFDRRGKKILVGDSASKFFILGKILLEDCTLLRNELEELRRNLLADPYFRGVESMKPERKKTAVQFHAKDDVPEVRREVFSLLLKHDIKFYAVVRNKTDLVSYVQQQNERDPSYRYRENDLYDTLTRQLFGKLRPFADEVNLIFARRGKSSRTAALQTALQHAENDFRKKFGFTRGHNVTISAEHSKNDPCLQACDYFLWALQRYYEREESRYIELMWPKVGEIHDLDVERGSKRGAFYTQKKPLISPEDSDSA